MRLQVLHLPAPADEYPFALVLDQCNTDEIEGLAQSGPDMRDHIGARAVLAFETEVEVA